MSAINLFKSGHGPDMQPRLRGENIPMDIAVKRLAVLKHAITNVDYVKSSKSNDNKAYTTKPIEASMFQPHTRPEPVIYENTSSFVPAVSDESTVQTTIEPQAGAVVTDISVNQDARATAARAAVAEVYSTESKAA